MTVEIQNGADGGPLFKLNPDPQSKDDAAFLSQFDVGTRIVLIGERLMVEGEGEWFAVKKLNPNV